jgi:hypothetical protein
LSFFAFGLAAAVSMATVAKQLRRRMRVSVRANAQERSTDIV